MGIQANIVSKVTVVRTMANFMINFYLLILTLTLYAALPPLPSMVSAVGFEGINDVAQLCAHGCIFVSNLSILS